MHYTLNNPPLKGPCPWVLHATAPLGQSHDKKTFVQPNTFTPQGSVSSQPSHRSQIDCFFPSFSKSSNSGKSPLHPAHHARPATDPQQVTQPIIPLVSWSQAFRKPTKDENVSALHCSTLNLMLWKEISAWGAWNCMICNLGLNLGLTAVFSIDGVMVKVTSSTVKKVNSKNLSTFHIQAKW